MLAALFSVAPSLAAGSGTWTLSGNLHVAREGHTATLLPSGNVVVAGGETQTTATTSTETYNPVTNKWTVSGNLKVARAGADAVLLQSGKILIAGGCVSTCLGGNTPTAELYNPATGTWALTGSMAIRPVYSGMALLSNGKVLAVGGCTGQNSNGCTGVTAVAEIYDPATGKWTRTGSLHVARGEFSTTLIAGGKVLVAGGINALGHPIRYAELYDPTTGLWTITGSLNVARDEHAATLLPNGRVLVAGGESTLGTSSGSAELYNPATQKWTLTGSLQTGRLEHTAVLLPNGTVLVSGGNKVTTSFTTPLASAEIYNVGTGTWTSTGSMHANRVGHTSTVLQSGLVLNAAGANAANELASTETYQP